MDGFKITKEEQKKVLDSLEKQQTTTESVNKNLTKMNVDMQKDWSEQSYREHKQNFMENYYQKWEANEETDYKDRLKKIEQVAIHSSMEGKFDKQEQPAESFWYKTRKNEKKKINDYRNSAVDEYRPMLHFGLNTVRELNALDKYNAYHKDYFHSRNNQRDIYDNYVGQDKNVVVQDWGKIYERQMKAHGKFFGALTGTWKGLKQRGADFLSKFTENKVSCRDEMDKGIRPFFSMTKNVIFWKKQVGLLGTETKEERKDGSEYNKRIMREYIANKDGGRTKVMNELALKLINFKLTPNMLSNKYLAANMLQMQRYTDMLNSFVFLTQCNPNYLDMNSKDHTDPDLAAVIWSRIILIAPIMKTFMETHARYCGYKKDEGLAKKGRTIGFLSNEEKKDRLNGEEEYQKFVEETWETLQKAYNSTTDYMDDAADAKMKAKLDEIENKANETRQKKAEKAGVEKRDQDQKKDQKQENKEETEFKLKYDATGEGEEKLKALKAQIMEKPAIYDLFGSEIDKIFNKYNEQMRRLDELKARNEAIKGLARKANSKEGITGGKKTGIPDLEQIWKDYIDKEQVRIKEETSILEQQLENYKGTIDFFTNIDLTKKELELNALPSVRNVLKYEGLEHIFKLKEAFEYNDLFYKTLDYYDFEKFDTIEVAGGKTIKLEDMQAQYNYTLLKRGMERTRFVNKLVDGKTQKDVKNPQMLNNIERRMLAQKNFTEYENQPEISDPEISIAEIVKITPEQLEKDYNITKELDVTNVDTFKKYFWLKKFIKICDGIEFDRKGPADYNTLSNNDKILVRAKGRLLRDYFHRWQGAMDYTKSEAYSYIYDTPNMEGNNQIIEGIDKEYRLSAMTDMQKKVQDKLDDFKQKHPNITEEDPEYAKLHKLNELNKFMLGMKEANNYQAKEIKILGKSALDSYIAQIYKDDALYVTRKLFSEDYDELVKDGRVFSGAKNKEEYVNKRVDNAILLKEQCEYFAKNKAECLSKLGMELPKHANVNYFTQMFENMKNERDGKELTDDEKAKYLRTYKDKFQIILNKVKTQYCKNGSVDDASIISNIRDILGEMEFIDNYIGFNHQTDEENPDLMAKIYSGEELDKLGEQEMLLSDFREYVRMLLADHGIADWDDYKYLKRKGMKRDLITGDQSFSGKWKQLDAERKALTEREKAESKREAEVKAEIAKIRRLMDDEKATQEELSFEEMKALYNKGDKRIEKKNICKFVAYRVKSKYDSQLKSLEEEKDRLEKNFDQLKDNVTLYQYLSYGAQEEEIKKNEKDLEKGEDWITARKRQKKDFIENSLKKMDMPAPRNFVDELFEYIHKKAGDMEFFDENKVEDILTKATKTFFFTLSKGARAEAELRLRRYKKDKTAMNDYFIWKNAKDSKEVLVERCKAFGQEEFARKNIDKIKNIMETIAETNASVNDMQNPRFLDELKEDLNLKGIDEKQFMFLLRSHEVGFAGKSVTKSNINKEDQNKADVDKYLHVETRDEFLVKAAEDALKVGESIKIDDVNEDYIVNNFAECYFNANKLLAFQQLYYGEKESFDRLYDVYGKRNTVQRIRDYFDKGHGESYVLFYNAVISVANKYGITEKGGLSFGLAPEEVETLQTQMNVDKKSKDEEALKKQKELQDQQKALKTQAGKNVADAQAKVTDSLDTMKTAYAQTKMAQKIRQSVSGTLVGVGLEDYVKVGDSKKTVVKRDTYGLKEGDIKQANELEKFYHGYTDAYQQTQKKYYEFKLKEQSTDEVTFTVSNSYHPQMLFFMAPEKGLTSATSKINAKSTVISFKNLLSDDVSNIAANLSVVDEEKCNNVIKMISDLKLDMGKISKPVATGKAIYEDDFFKEKLEKDPDFYVSMINAMNFCVLYENGNDSFNIPGYRRQIESAFTKAGNEKDMYTQWEAKEIAEKEYDKMKAKVENYDKELKNLIDQRETLEMDMLRLKATPESVIHNSLLIQDKSAKMAELDSKINNLTRESEAQRTVANSVFDNYYKVYEDLYKNGKAHAEQYDTMLLSPNKLNSLTKIQSIFSDPKTRFMVSTYFDLFSAYLLKNGIKIDGSLVNANIYDESLAEITRSKEGKANMSKSDALVMGKEVSTQARENAIQLFNAKQEYIKSGDYLKEYKALETRQTMLDREDAAMPGQIHKTFDAILAKKKKSKIKDDVEFMLNGLTDEEKLKLRKYGRSNTEFLEKRKQQAEAKTLANLRELIILTDVYDKVLVNQGSKNISLVLKQYSSDELTVIKSYKGQFAKYTDRFFDAENIFEMLRAYVVSREDEYLEECRQKEKAKKEIEKQQNGQADPALNDLFSINSVD